MCTRKTYDGETLENKECGAMFFKEEAISVSPTTTDRCGAGSPWRKEAISGMTSLKAKQDDHIKRL